MSELNDFITAQHALNLDMARALSRIEQSQLDTKERLFGSANSQGVLPYLVEQSKVQAKEEKEEITKLVVRTASLESWRTGTVKWVAGVVAVLGLEGTALAVYINHVAATAHVIQSVIKPH
jgi:hypothetical protein